MASGQTSNYGLNQWTAEDNVLREEFNVDNRKIDEALCQIPKIVSGTYKGTENVSALTKINLGFRPSLVIITRVNSWEPTNCIMLSPDHPLMYNTKVLAKITDTGFSVGSAYHDGTSFITPHLNAKSTYCYMAFS